jgi:DNA polymerase-3 subunit gamma/tau
MIALAGDGSIRDSLSTLDQAIASFGKTLRAADVRQLLGIVGAEALDEATEALLEQSPSRMLALADRLTAEGQNLQHFCRELTRYFRNLLVARVMGADSRLIAATQEERRKLGHYAPKFSEEDLTRYLQLILNLYRELHFAPHPRFHLEMGLLRLVHASRLVSIEEALAGAASPAAPSKPARPTSPPAPREAAPARESSGPSDLRSRLEAEIHAELTGVKVTGGTVVIEAPADYEAVLNLSRQAVEKICAQVLGRRVKVEFAVGAAPAKPAGSPQQDEETSARALRHPQVQSFVSAFGGRVREVRNLRENES